jgi:hypothetical protein
MKKKKTATTNHLYLDWAFIGASCDDLLVYADRLLAERLPGSALIIPVYPCFAALG